MVGSRAGAGFSAGVGGAEVGSERVLVGGIDTVGMGAEAFVAETMVEAFLLILASLLLRLAAICLLYDDTVAGGSESKTEEESTDSCWTPREDG
jgi:hypothetical protein